MSKRILFSIFAVISILMITGAISGSVFAQDKFAGSWSGGWTGASSGKFELTITKETGGTYTAAMSPKNDEGEQLTVRWVSTETKDNNIKLKFTNEDGTVEIIMEAALDAGSLKGTYSVRAKENGEEVDKGNWTASKK